MPYATSNPPVLKVPAFTAEANESRTWAYFSTDAAADVDADGYITNARDLGMKVGDLVEVTDTDASPVIVTLHRVVAINANGSADLSNGTTIVAGTDSD